MRSRVLSPFTPRSRSFLILMSLSTDFSIANRPRWARPDTCWRLEARVKASRNRIPDDAMKGSTLLLLLITWFCLKRL
ncbi:unnamed protein product [Peronospora belbahrii]|uniref:Uncharacterized protein n=1 Tax=Peronospora belbahrii TaxID=622444 RepID=A0ABN8D6E1_9STRA|nr:unnamed protein product [Peronospora belbahrii]